MKIRDFIVCDDIRQEIGNKHTLVGVYDESIQFNVARTDKGKWPKAIRLGFYIRLRFDEDDPEIDSFSMHVRFNQGQERKVGDVIRMDDRQSRNVNLVLQHGRFQIPEESTLHFTFRFYNDGEPVLDVSPEDNIQATERDVAL